MTQESVLSRHRLPPFYRIGLAMLWLTPVTLFILTILLSHSFSLGVFDVRFLLCLALMCLPALYVWREGVDVLRGGLRVRVHFPRTYSYAELDTWYYDARPDKHVLTIWKGDNHRVLECRAGHLTDLPQLMRALKANVRWRNWPE